MKGETRGGVVWGAGMAMVWRNPGSRVRAKKAKPTAGEETEPANGTKT